jgi:Sap, sulfolipid-1-addressing protein
MASLYVEVLPLALGAAVSPGVLTLELLILSGKVQPKLRAWLYLTGAALVLVAFSFLALTVLRNVSEATGGPPNPWSIGVKSVIALGLLALGLRQLHPKKTLGEVHQSRVKGRLQTAKAPAFVVVGIVAMLSNFSTLVLYIPAMHVINLSDDPVSTKVTAGLMLLIITITPILLPVLAVTVVGHRSDALLARVNGFTGRHSRQINAGICLAFAALLAYSAVKEARS